MAVRATLEHGPDFKPARVRDDRGHVWMVQEVIEHWQHPESAPDTLGRAGCITRWVLRVWGPVPHNPSAKGEFTMRAERYGDRPGWWIEPG